MGTEQQRREGMAAARGPAVAVLLVLMLAAAVVFGLNASPFNGLALVSFIFIVAGVWMLAHLADRSHR